MGKIKLLDKNLINQIAAGEVVERPASVVKELIENSIDAGATRVEVAISNDCRNIRIADNGCGIDSDDIELAFSKHATSKISVEQDLYEIGTLGFRGEALASLISIAKVTCITKQKNDEIGTKAICENSNVKKSPTGCANGTTMEIEDLFYNIPARLKFLRNEKTEIAYITEIVQSISLSHPQIAITLKNKNNVILQTFGTGELLNTVSDLYSPDVVKQLVPINKIDELSNLKITGYTSRPNFTRSSNKSIHLFINGRTVKDPILLRTISNVYQHLIPKGKYPLTIINLTMPYIDVDVNVHPSKKEVRYKNTNQIFNFVYSALNSALSNQRVLISHDEAKQQENYFKKEKNQQLFSSPIQEKSVSFFSRLASMNINSSSISSASKLSLSTKEAESFVSVSDLRKTRLDTDAVMSMYNPIEPVQKELNIEKPIGHQDEKVNVIGQFANTYILVELEDGLEIIDQHIAHERYYYEKLKENHEISSQGLLFSDIIDLEPTDVEILKLNYEELQKFGYGIEFLSDTEITFRKLPTLIANIEPRQIVSSLLDEIYNSEGSIEEKILISTSCRASVKANTKLLPAQMEDIVKKWRSTKRPTTCPHGRPISKIISKSEIASFFLRN